MTTVGADLIEERIPDAAAPAAPASEQVRSASDAFAYLLTGPHSRLRSAGEIHARLQETLPALTASAFQEHESTALLEVHKILYTIYELSLGNPLSPAVAHEHSPWLCAIRQELETQWLRDELPRVEADLPSPPYTRDSICHWFEVHARKYSNLDRTVVDYLAERATLDDFVTFIVSDGYLNYRFYDALVLSMLHYSETVKAEIIRHLWDECGEGDEARAHTRQFTRTLQRIGSKLPSPPIWNDWRPYAGYNLYFLLGLNRRHYFKAIASLAMPELFDPDRDRAVVEGLRRLGFRPEIDFEYFHSHIEGDEEHGPCWLQHVIRPIVEAHPEASRELAIGGALRMAAMSRYNAYLADRFNLAEGRYGASL